MPARSAIDVFSQLCPLDLRATVRAFDDGCSSLLVAHGVIMLYGAFISYAMTAHTDTLFPFCCCNCYVCLRPLTCAYVLMALLPAAYVLMPALRRLGWISSLTLSAVQKAIHCVSSLVLLCGVLVVVVLPCKVCAQTLCVKRSRLPPQQRTFCGQTAPTLFKLLNSALTIHNACITAYALGLRRGDSRQTQGKPTRNRNAGPFPPGAASGHILAAPSAALPGQPTKGAQEPSKEAACGAWVQGALACRGGPCTVRVSQPLYSPGGCCSDTWVSL